MGDLDKNVTMASGVGGLVGSKVIPDSTYVQSGMSLTPINVAKSITGLRMEAAL